MKRLLASFLPVLAFSIVCLPLTGCPTGTGTGPVLQINPVAINFGSLAEKKTIGITNSGSGAITWSIQESIDWLSADVTVGTTTTELDRVKFTADRTGLPVGTYTGTVTVASSAGVREIAVAMSVPGTPTIDVSPLTINLLNEQETAQFTITNNGDGPLTWSVELQDVDDPGTEIDIPAYMTVTPTGGTTLPGDQSVVEIEIDRDLMEEAGVTGFLFFITSNIGDATVTMNIAAGASAAIGVEPTVLDFGTSGNVLTFDVYNSGEAGSILDFTVSTDRPDLIFLDPVSGSSTGVLDPLNYDRVSIGVTIDRGALTGETDGGIITVAAPGLEDVEIVVNVEASPLGFEGAQNRSRPPFILRFVFLLRDALGEAIDTTDPAVLEELQTAFTVYEDQVPLDIDETNLFVSSAEHLKSNIVLLLDYTGSMYNAPPGNGVVIEQMVNASAEFINDLPDSQRLAIMEYHERQQTDRLIHNFSTSKSSLISGLEAFSVPFGEHGASEVNDAIVDACERLENEDLGLLELNNADVRAVIFISDGRDTSSVNDVDEVIDIAKDKRVRLYPIGFGQNVRASALIKMATETGGHYYPAPTAADLVNLLQNESTAGPGAPGVIAKELERQIVLTYISLFTEGSHTYLITGNYQGLEGSFQEDAVFAIGGDIHAGQIGLRSAGIQPDNSATVFVRSEYVPRNINQMRVRVISAQPFTLSLDPEGLLQDWILVNEGGGVYTALTSELTPLRYGAFGNLFRVDFTGVVADFNMGFRVDNQVYVNPPFTKFFQYPTLLPVTTGSSDADVLPILVEQGFDPDALDAWDADEDGTTDFNDLSISSYQIPDVP
ncbi:MAG: VWA domain-containing protein [Candidatus Hydrogenedentes bacterium]|nr:VWA domain-containing protein [Candidatus Hydrogenedentota bacterium]